MKIEVVKGFCDYTGEEAQRRATIKEIIVETFEKYGFEPAETPIIEYEEFVKGSPLQAQDEVISDIFKLKDKGKRKLALRYEFTFQLKRLVKNKKLPYKRYQIGEVFRDEPVSANRLRQFTQCDVDVVGSSIKDEAEILALTEDILNKLRIPNKIFVGNRKLLNEILEEQKIKKKQEVIREIDKIGKLSETKVKLNLKKYGAERIISIFKKNKSYFKKYKLYREIEELEKYLKIYNVEAEFLPSLARGLSYYNGNVFEIKTSNMKESICGGGSYEINNLPATGISFGLERIEELAKIKLDKEEILVVSLAQDKEAIKLTEKLRKGNKKVVLYYGKPSKALQYANSKKINEVIFVGKEELKKGKFKIRDMKTGKEKFKKF